MSSNFAVYIAILFSLLFTQKILSTTSSFSDPSCITYDSEFQNVCLECNVSQNQYRLLINPQLVICGYSPNSAVGTQCSFNTQLYPTLSQIDQSQFKMSKYDQVLKENNYCLSSQFYEYPCLMYQETTNFNWTKFNAKQTKFNFTLVRNQIVFESMPISCSSCSQDYSLQFGVLQNLNLSYLGCSAQTQCDQFSFYDSETQGCIRCNDKFDNCLGCNSSQCTTCPNGYYYHPAVYDFRVQTLTGKCVFGIAPSGYCTDIFGLQNIPSQNPLCKLCQDSLGIQSCSECIEGYILQNGSCIARQQQIDTRNRFVQNTSISQYLAKSDFTTQCGLQIAEPAFSIHKVLNDIYESLNNGTYSGVSLTIYLFSGDHYLLLCTGSDQEQSLFSHYPELTNLCLELNLYRQYTSLDTINITIRSLNCNIKSQLNLTTDDSQLFNQYCSTTSSSPNIQVNSPYSYFNITGQWVFQDLNFIGMNSMVKDPIGYYDFRVIPTLLCNITKEPSGYDGVLAVSNVHLTGTSIRFVCTDTYQGTSFPFNANFICLQNDGSKYSQSIESSLKCGVAPDSSVYFFQNPNGVYSMRQKTLFNLFSFSQNMVAQPQLTSLSIINCTFQYFYGDFDSLINIEQGTIAQTEYNGMMFYFYNGMISGGNITIINSTFQNSRFCRGLIFSRKLTYDLDYSMSFVNLTLLGELYPQLEYLKYQSLLIVNSNFTYLNGYKGTTALAYFNGQPTYTILSFEIYQPLQLLKPIHVGIVLNLEDYPGSVLIANSVFDKNMHYISQYNNTITFDSERQLLKAFVKQYDSQTSEVKLGICNSNTDFSAYLFGHGFFASEQNDIEVYFDIFERLSTIYISKNQRMIYIVNNVFTNNIGTFGGAICINTPNWNSYSNIQPIVVINNNQFESNMAYLSGNGVYIRSTVFESDYSSYCGAGIQVNTNSFSSNIGTKLSNGGALSHVCTYLQSNNILEQPSSIQPSQVLPQIIINDTEVLGPGNSLFQMQITVELLSFTMQDNSFIFNLGGQRGSAVYLFQISNTSSQNNNYIRNTAVQLYFEQIYSPFYKYLSQGVSFVFHDQIYGYSDEYSVMIEKYPQYGLQLSTGIGKLKISRTMFKLQYSQISGALALFYCLDDQCVQNRVQIFNDIGSYWESNDVGQILFDNFLVELCSALYISGGKEIYLNSSSFITHRVNQRTINFLDRYSQPSMTYNEQQILASLSDTSHWSQATLIIYNIRPEFLSSEVHFNLTFTNCYFHQNNNMQFFSYNDLSYGTWIYYYGQIRLNTTQKQVNGLIATISLYNTTLLENVFYGVQGTTFHIYNGLIQATNITVIGNGAMQNQTYMLTYGFIKQTSDSYLDMSKYYTFIESSQFIYCFGLKAAMIYFSGQNQRLELNNNFFYGLGTASNGAVLSYDMEYYPESNSYIKMSNNHFKAMFGAVFFITVDGVQNNGGLVIIENCLFQDIVGNYFARIIYVKESLGLILQNITVNTTEGFNLIDTYCNLHEQYLKTSCQYMLFDADYVQQEYVDWGTYYYLHMTNYQPKLYLGQNQYLQKILDETLIQYSQVQFQIGIALILNSNFYSNNEKVGIINCINSSIILDSNLTLPPSKQTMITDSSSYMLPLISINQGTILVGNNLLFRNNYGFNQGSQLPALIFVDRSKIQLQNVTFLQNTFSDSMLIQMSEQSNFFCDNCTFIENRVGYGIIISKGYQYLLNNVTIKNSIFIKNSFWIYMFYLSFGLNQIESSQFIGQQGNFTILLVNSSLNFLNSIVNQSANYNQLAYPSISLQTGFLYLLEESQVVVNQSQFYYIAGNISSVIYASKNTLVSVIGSAFQNCSTTSIYGGVLTLQANSITFINGSSFESNRQVDVYAEKCYLFVDSSNFKYSYSSIQVLNSQLTVTSSDFTQSNPTRQASQGAAVYCDCNSTIIDLSQFTSLQAMYGGAVYLSQSSIGGTFSITRSIFQQNQAIQGGAIFIQNAADLSLKKNQFIQNTAQSNYNISRDYGLGGAMFINCYNADLKQIGNCRTLLTHNNFQNNYASEYGESIIKVTNATILSTNNTFSNQSKQVVTYPSKVQVIQQTSTVARILSTSNESISLHMGSGEPMKLVLTIFDELDQQYTCDNQSQAFAFALDSSVAFINNKQYAQEGVFNFSSLIALLAPGSSAVLYIQFVGLQTYQALVDFVLEPINITIVARHCILGEEWTTSNVCSQCDPSTYILTVPTNISLCQNCPEGGICNGTNIILALQGYQRSAKNYTRFINCTIPSSCLNGTDASPDGTCAAGYTGVVCGTCMQGYYMKVDFSCAQCSKSEQSQIQLVAVCLALAAVTYILVKSSISPDNKVRPTYSVYIKIFANYLQILGSISSIDLELPTNIQQYFDVQSNLLSISNQIYQLQCLTQNEYLPKIPQAYLKLILISVMPIVLILFNSMLFGFLYSFYHIRGRTKQNLLNQGILASIVLLYLIHPDITQCMFSAFNCISIDGDLRFKSYQQDICYTGQHLFYLLTVVLPSIIIWVFGIPLIFAYQIFKYHKLNQELQGNLDIGNEKLKQIESMKQNLNFLFNGYRLEVFYWELIIMMRKLIIIIGTVFFQEGSPEAQILIVILIVYYTCYLQNQVHPYYLKCLNSMEQYSLVAALATLYFGIFYLSGLHYSQFDSDSYKYIFLIIIALPNTLFFLYWFYRMREEMLKELYKKNQYNAISVLQCRRYDSQRFYIEYIKNDPTFKTIEIDGQRVVRQIALQLHSKGYQMISRNAKPEEVKISVQKTVLFKTQKTQTPATIGLAKTIDNRIYEPTPQSNIKHKIQEKQQTRFGNLEPILENENENSQNKLNMLIEQVIQKRILKQKRQQKYHHDKGLN